MVIARRAETPAMTVTASLGGGALWTKAIP